MSWKLEVKMEVRHRKVALAEKRFWFELAEEEFGETSVAPEGKRNEVRKYVRQKILFALKEMTSSGQAKE